MLTVHLYSLLGSYVLYSDRLSMHYSFMYYGLLQAIVGVVMWLQDFGDSNTYTAVRLEFRSRLESRLLQECLGMSFHSKFLLGCMQCQRIIFLIKASGIPVGVDVDV